MEAVGVDRGDQLSVDADTQIAEQTDAHLPVRLSPLDLVYGRVGPIDNRLPVGNRPHTRGRASGRRRLRLRLRRARWERSRRRSRGVLRSFLLVRGAA